MVLKKQTYSSLFMIKNNLKNIIGLILGNNSMSKVIRYINKRKLLIIYYHRVVEQEDLVNIKCENMCINVRSFEDQMRFLSQEYNPISEREIISLIKGNHSIPENSVWVTFDDGYKDNYTNAYPILKKYKIPGTIFITTGFINKKAIPCEDYIARAVRKTDLREFNFVLNKTEYRFLIETEEDKSNTIEKLWNIMNNKNICLDEYLDTLMNSLKLKKEDVNDLFMNWQEIRELNNNGIYIGAHTVNHKILLDLTSKEIEEEVSGSKSEIEEKLGSKVLSFAYPRGKKTDYNYKTVYPILKRHGFILSVSTMGGKNNLVHGADLFNLKRLGISYKDTLEFFKVKTSSGGFWQK